MLFWKEIATYKEINHIYFENDIGLTQNALHFVIIFARSNYASSSIVFRKSYDTNIFLNESFSRYIMLTFLSNNSVTLDQFLALTPEQLAQAFEQGRIKANTTYDFVLDGYKIQGATLYIILAIVASQNIPNTHIPQNTKIPVILQQKNSNPSTISKNGFTIICAAALSGDVRNILALLPDQLVTETRIINEMKRLVVPDRNNSLAASLKKTAFSALSTLEFIPQYSYELLKFYFSQNRNSRYFLEFDLNHLFVALLRSMQPDKSSNQAVDCKYLLSLLNSLHKRDFALSLKMLDLLHDIYNSSAIRDINTQEAELGLSFFQRVMNIGTDPICLMLTAEACTSGIINAPPEFTRFKIYQEAYNASSADEDLLACRELALYRMKSILAENPSEGFQAPSNIYQSTNQILENKQSFDNYCNLAQLYLNDNRKREALLCYEKAFSYAYSVKLKEILKNYLLEMRRGITPSISLWLDVQLFLVNLYSIMDSSMIDSVFDEIINQTKENNDFHDKVIDCLNNALDAQNEDVKNYWLWLINNIIVILTADFLKEKSSEKRNNKFAFINRFLQIILRNEQFDNILIYILGLYGHSEEINAALSNQYIRIIKQLYIENKGGDFEEIWFLRISNHIDALLKQLEDESFAGNKKYIAELILSLTDFLYQQNLFNLCYSALCNLYLKLNSIEDKDERDRLKNDVIDSLLNDRLVERFSLNIHACAGHHFYLHENVDRANEQFNRLIVSMREAQDFELSTVLVDDLSQMKEQHAFKPAWITLIKYHIAANDLITACCLAHDVLANQEHSNIHNDAMNALNIIAQQNYLPAIIFLSKFKLRLSQDIAEIKNLLSQNPFSDIIAYSTMPEPYLTVLMDGFYERGIDLLESNETTTAKKCLHAAGILGHGKASYVLAKKYFNENNISDCLAALELATDAKKQPQGLAAVHLLKLILKIETLDKSFLDKILDLLALAVYQQIEINYENPAEAKWNELQTAVYYLTSAGHRSANYLMLIVTCNLYSDSNFAVELFFNRLAPMQGDQIKPEITYVRARYHESRNEGDEAAKYFQLFVQEASVPTCGFFFPLRITKSLEHANEVIHQHENTL